MRNTFCGAKLKVKKTPKGAENVVVDLNPQQEIDTYNKLLYKVLMRRVKYDSQDAQKGLKIFKVNDGDSLIMHLTKDGDAHKFVWKSPGGNEELIMTANSTDKNMRDSYSALGKILNSRVEEATKGER